MRTLVVTQTPSMDLKMRTRLPQLGAEAQVVNSLAEASRELRTGSPTAVLIDLCWSPSWAGSLAAWVARHLTGTGIRVVLTADTPLARDLDYVPWVREATFLPRDFDLLDLAEAIGADPLRASLAA